MNARFVFACAAAGIAMTAFGATTASADEATFTGNLGFFADAARPGDEIEFFGGCDDQNFVSATLVSDVLVAGEAFGTDDSDGGWKFTGVATILDDAKPGSHPVSFQCGTTTVTADVVVEEPDQTIPRAEVTVDPGKGEAGDEILVEVLCSEQGEVTSDALEIGELTREGADPNADPMWFATATVRDVEPGTYDVESNCGVAPISTTFTVTGAVAPVKDAQVPVKPKGAADTGTLDSPVAADDTTHTGLLIGAGVALAAAAGGAGVLAYRRRQQG